MSDFSSSSSFNQSSSSFGGGATSSPKKSRKSFKNSPLFPIGIVVVVVLVIATVAINHMSKSSGSSMSASQANSQVAVDKPIAQQTLNKSFNFPLNDATGKQVSTLQYEIQDVQLLNQIIVKGERATAVQGRTFLIVDLKITNNFDKSVQLNSKDYVRLMVGNSSEKLAADIHNDPVDVQAISTKYTRLGFPIDANQRDLTLQVGEITGKKETIKLDLK